jgi:catechol 2,3-dioxygenase-like lactoylglutathione lyase family enzyme
VGGGDGAGKATRALQRRTGKSCVGLLVEIYRRSSRQLWTLIYRARRTGAAVVDMKLEVVVVPVSDVDQAKGFYEALGWRLDADFAGDGRFRVVQLTPPGSACSIIFGSGITPARPGSAEGLQLVVTDIEAARAELVDRGVDVSEVFHDTGGVFHPAGAGPGRGAAGRRRRTDLGRAGDGGPT